METRLKLTLKAPISINIEELDGITQEDITRHLNYCLKRSGSNHPPFDNQMLSHGLHEIIKLAICNAIEENHSKRYPGTVSYSTENVIGEIARWLLTSKKIINRIQHYFTGVLKAELK